MEATYKLSESEYVRGNKLFTQLSKKSKIRYSICIFILILTALLASSPALQGGAVFAIVGGFIGHFAQRFMYAPWATKKQYRNYKAVQNETIIKFDENGLKFQSADGAGTIKWQDIYNWRENNEFILVYQAPYVYHIIPKSLSDQGFNISELVSILTEKVKNKT